MICGKRVDDVYLYISIPGSRYINHLKHKCHIWVFPKIGIPQTWMVKIMENPMNKWMIFLGAKPTIFRKDPYLHRLHPYRKHWNRHQPQDHSICQASGRDILMSSVEWAPEKIGLSQKRCSSSKPLILWSYVNFREGNSQFSDSHFCQCLPFWKTSVRLGHQHLSTALRYYTFHDHYWDAHGSY